MTGLTISQVCVYMYPQKTKEKQEFSLCARYKLSSDYFISICMQHSFPCSHMLTLLRGCDFQIISWYHHVPYISLQDYSVHASWRQRHAVMTPLFAVTQMSQSMGSSEDSVDGQIRATQDAQQFTATVEAGGLIWHGVALFSELTLCVFCFLWVVCITRAIPKGLTFRLCLCVLRL